jgi:hypothetical protein
MKYMILIYGNESTGINPGTPEFGAYMAGYQKATDTYRKDGVMVAGEALQPVSTATSLRVRKGRNETMDGPFAETKEQLGCANLDDAIRYAAMIPDAATGTVEIRPIMSFD